MRSYRFVQLDVFTNERFCGNPLAVFSEAVGLNDEQLQAIAREMNLSETVFVFPSQKENALRRLRIFTPSSELPMAGHPVVGTWNQLAREGVVEKPLSGSGAVRVMHELNIGVLPVEIDFYEGEPVRVVMTQGAFELGQLFESTPENLAQIAAALSIAPTDIDERAPIQIASTGNPWLIVGVKTLEALSRCRVNETLFEKLYAQTGFVRSRCYVFSPETIEKSNDDEETRIAARAFVSDLGIIEDPATGSAAGPLGGYLAHYDLTSANETNGAHRFLIEQGDFIKRPSRIEVSVKKTDRIIEEVLVGGASVVVARGEVFVD